jgi:hypothetical protein
LVLLLSGLVAACVGTRGPVPAPSAPSALDAHDGGPGGSSAVDAAASAEVPDALAPTSKPTAEALPLPPSPPEGSLPAPAVFAKLTTATSVELHDEWVGLGSNYDVVIRLDLTGDTYTVRAKFASEGASVGESVHDPTAPADVAFKCTCTIDKTCPCEHAHVERKTSTVAASVVHDFLRALATHGFPKPPTPGTMAKGESLWTDDYPRGHVAVFLPGEKAPLHFSFWNQKRAWRFNGKTLSEEPPKSTTDPIRISHSYTWAFYQRLLDRAGLSEWSKQK